MILPSPPSVHSLNSLRSSCGASDDSVNALNCVPRFLALSETLLNPLTRRLESAWNLKSTVDMSLSAGSLHGRMASGIGIENRVFWPFFFVLSDVFFDSLCLWKLTSHISLLHSSVSMKTQEQDLFGVVGTDPHPVRQMVIHSPSCHRTSVSPPSTCMERTLPPYLCI